MLRLLQQVGLEVLEGDFVGILVLAVVLSPFLDGVVGQVDPFVPEVSAAVDLGGGP